MPGAPKSSQSRAHSRVNQRVVLPLVAGVVVFLIALTFLPFTGRLLLSLNRSLLDEYHRRGDKTPANPNVVVLAIDDASLSLSQAWPEDIAASPALQAMKGRFTNWPRRLWALTLDRLFQAGAKLVFLDLTFFGTTTPEDDKALADALKKYAGKVIVAAKFSEGQPSQLNYPDPVITGGDVPEDGTWGYINYWPESDEIVRSARYQTTRWKVEGGVPDPSERPVPSVALALAGHINVNASADVPEWERLRFCAADSFPPHSLHEIFVPAIWTANYADGALFKDKVVLVGSTSPEHHDFHQIPLGIIPGVNVHGHALSALLAHSFITAAPAWWPWAGLLLGAFIAWTFVTYVRHPVFSLLALWLITGGVVWLTFAAFNKLSVEASPVPFALALNGCGVLGLTGNFLSQLRETRKLSRFIQRYHSPDRVALLLKDRENIFTTLGGVERTVTILFSDVRGFTTLSEGMTPEQLVTQLNEYLSRMVEKVFLSHGSIDKFIGDAVMALWGSMPQSGAPGQGLKQDALHAVTSAVAMRDVLAELNTGWRERGIPQLGFGVGIHQGHVVVGNIGSAAPYERMELTVIGDSVNLASRLEGVTKEYGVDIIISDAVQRHVKDAFLCRSADLVQVKGKALPVEVFTVMDKRGTLEPRGLIDFELGIAAYRAGRFTEALAAFNRAAAAGLSDALTALYQERCQSLLDNPPETWTGVYVMKKK